MLHLLSDLRHGARLLVRSPGFAAVALVALALGIGANSAVFSVIDTVLLRPLAYPEPGRLVMVWEDASHVGFPRNTPAPANFIDWRAQNRVFTDIAASRGRMLNLTGDGPPEMVMGPEVTGNMWDVLGVRPLAGRTFTEAEEMRDEKVVVIGYALWQRRFGGERSVVGRKILINDEPFTVIGIMPRGFSVPPRKNEMWVPAQFRRTMATRRGSHFLSSVARLKPGVSVKQAQAEMSVLARRLELQYPRTNTHVGAVVVPLREELLGNTRLGLMVLFGASACVLLIACANLGNLYLARAQARRREMAVRTALGAGTGRILSQMIAEGLLLSLLGAAAGLALARWSVTLLQKMVPLGMVDRNVHLDMRVLLFTMAVAVLTSVIFGAVPAFSMAGMQIQNTLREGGRGHTGKQRLFRNTLVVAEMALSIVLLTGAGLMIQTLAHLKDLDAGFRTDHLLTALTPLPRPRYADFIRREAFVNDVIARVKALPGVIDAAYTSALPYTATGNTNGFRIEGRPQPPNGNTQDALLRTVSSNYMQMMGARLKEGRFFGPGDRKNTAPVVIINETFANQYWPGTSPLGARIRTDTDTWFTVAGVIHDLRERGFEAALKAGVYHVVPQAHDIWAEADELAVRTASDPLSLAPAVRQAVWSVDKDEPVFGVRSMEEIMDVEVAGRKQQMNLLGAFAFIALTLACIGIYGVLSYAVTQRTREIGLRLALGATGSGIARMIVGQGLKLTALGAAIGAAAAFAATSAMSSLLYGVSAADPRTLIAVTALLSAVALAACYVPAWRAARVDPAVTLREE